MRELTALLLLGSFPRDTHGIYILAFTVLELRPDEQDIFQTCRDIIGANGKCLLYLVRESWNCNLKLRIYNPTPGR